ncbi:MAG: chemotaxis protein CheW [Terriglobia bacterium]|jgi:chemotaxis-related protein WspB
MLLLIFQAGTQTYGLDTRQVVEVAPYPECTLLAHAPPFVAGLAKWRGRTIPLIDLSALIGGTSAPALLSTRLVVVDYLQSNGHRHPLGLVAEKAVEILELDESDLEPQKVGIPDAPYLNGTMENAGRLIQRVTVNELLPVSVRELLFPEAEAV